MPLSCLVNVICSGTETEGLSSPATCASGVTVGSPVETPAPPPAPSLAPRSTVRKELCFLYGTLAASPAARSRDPSALVDARALGGARLPASARPPPPPLLPPLLPNAPPKDAALPLDTSLAPGAAAAAGRNRSFSTPLRAPLPCAESLLLSNGDAAPAAAAAAVTVEATVAAVGRSSSSSLASSATSSKCPLVPKDWSVNLDALRGGGFRRVGVAAVAVAVAVPAAAAPAAVGDGLEAVAAATAAEGLMGLPSTRALMSGRDESRDGETAAVEGSLTGDGGGGSAVADTSYAGDKFPARPLPEPTPQLLPRFSGGCPAAATPPVLHLASGPDVLKPPDHCSLRPPPLGVGVAREGEEACSSCADGKVKALGSWRCSLRADSCHDSAPTASSGGAPKNAAPPLPPSIACAASTPPASLPLRLRPGSAASRVLRVRMNAPPPLACCPLAPLPHKLKREGPTPAGDREPPPAAAAAAVGPKMLAG